MYPHNGAAAVDLRLFPQCEGVLDIVYNPALTALLLQAEKLNIPHAGGLSMLVAQAKRSSEQFTGTVIGDEALERVERTVNHRLRNIILIGMPGSGKSAVAAALGKALGREVVEADELIAQRTGMSIPEIFARSRGGNIPETGNRGSGGAGQALRHHPLHRRRLRHPGGKLPAAASKRHHFPPDPRPCQAANGGPSHFPSHGPRSALRPPGAAVPPLCRRDGVQRRGAGGHGTNHQGGAAMKLLVINGPNLNLLGLREPAIYGSQNYESLLTLVRAACDAEGIEVGFAQSNHEGAIVDAIQAAYGVYDGIVINPAAYTHTSIAILDALKAVAIPAVEVHISDVDSREPVSFRSPTPAWPRPKPIKVWGSRAMWRQ